MIEVVKGNLLDADEFCIVHQVNCQGRMGKGVAKAIIDRYPDVKSDYVSFCRNKNPEDLLGAVLYTKTNSEFGDPSYYYIASIFSQLDYRRRSEVGNRCYTDYDAFKKCIAKIRYLDLPGFPIAMPYMIGCGLAGGDWEKIYGILDKYYGKYSDPTLRLYKLD